ncbi:MAG: Sir2 family NAD-dependent protein deacetylase, partial [Bacteroidota bacterium]
VTLITQNIDDLHERAGSTKVLHLHGEIRKVESIANPSLVYELDGWELKEGDTGEDGEQLRPHVVWFGEMVPNMGIAQPIVQSADIVLVVGTSLNVYPAAGLVLSATAHSRKFLVDPQDVPINKDIHNLTYYRETAGVAVPRIVDELLA